MGHGISGMWTPKIGGRLAPKIDGTNVETISTPPLVYFLAFNHVMPEYSLMEAILSVFTYPYLGAKLMENM